MIAVARDEHAKMPLNIKTIRDFVLSHTDLMGTAATPFAPVVNAITGMKPVKKNHAQNHRGA